MGAEPTAPRWRTVTHPGTGRRVTYAVVTRNGERIVIIKRRGK